MTSVFSIFNSCKHYLKESKHLIFGRKLVNFIWFLKKYYIFWFVSSNSIFETKTKWVSSLLKDLFNRVSPKPLTASLNLHALMNFGIADYIPLKMFVHAATLNELNWIGFNRNSHWFELKWINMSIEHTSAKINNQINEPTTIDRNGMDGWTN